VSFGFFTFTLGRLRSRRLFRTFVKYYLVGEFILVFDVSSLCMLCMDTMFLLLMLCMDTMYKCLCRCACAYINACVDVHVLISVPVMLYNDLGYNIYCWNFIYAGKEAKQRKEGTMPVPTPTARPSA
jgi:hypothetical protein